MLARIAAVTEPNRPAQHLREALDDYRRKGQINLVDLISLNVEKTLEYISPAGVVVPTVSGHTARMISRFKLPVWIIAVSPQEATCQHLQFAYGVYPWCEKKYPLDWNTFARKLRRTRGMAGKLFVLTEGPSPRNPKANHRLEIIDLDRAEKRAR